jgi:hypothetical protein
MQWDFTPDEVVRGEVDYGLKEFRCDLRKEIAANLNNDDELFVQECFVLIYDLCYWMSTGRKFAEFASTLDESAPLEVHVLQVISEYMRDNITMLGAILQRDIMDGVENGMTVDQAVDRTAENHASEAAILPLA